MSRTKNIINTIIVYLLTVGAFVAATVVGNANYYYGNAFISVVFYLIGVVAFGFINCVAHETGHMLAAKKNGFAFCSVSIWFFKWTKRGKKTEFSFTGLGEQSGYTETVPKYKENMDKRLIAYTRGGIIASLIMTVIGIAPLFLTDVLSKEVYGILSMALPMGAYYFFDSLIPRDSDGERNDGMVIKGVKEKDDRSVTLLRILEIQAEMYGGKTPSEIDESMYFDLPQLPENDPMFFAITQARYNYYLDKKDYENAEKTTNRLLVAADSLPKGLKCEINAYALYNACTFSRNPEKADELMYEAEDYLNKYNTLTNIRIKLAYLYFIVGERGNVDTFYKKGIKEAKKCPLKGYGIFETKLLDEIKADYDKNTDEKA